MGGAYLTLLNTIANLGFTLPKFLIFAGGCLGVLGQRWEGRGRGRLSSSVNDR